ncbi:MAG: HIT domain-containing protein [Thiolinea sp.]
MTFSLHPQLAQDCLVVGDLPLCRVLLMNEARYPWLILVPRRENLREIHQLEAADRLQFWQESAWVSEQLEVLFQPDKLNVAALGNMVAQLHVHHIARYRQDAAWPAPVWGKFAPEAYNAEA